MYNRPYIGTNEYSPAYWSQWCPGRNQVAVKNKLPFTRTYPLIMIQYKYALARYKRLGRTWHAAQSVNVIVKRLRMHGVKLPKVKPSLDSLKAVIVHDIEEAGYDPNVNISREIAGEFASIMDEYVPDYAYSEGARNVFFECVYCMGYYRQYEHIFIPIIARYIGE